MFLTLLAGRWRLILEVAGIVIALIWIGAVTTAKNHYKADRDAIEAQFGAFKDQVSRLGKEAEAKAKQREADDAHRIKAAEADAARARGDLARWLRDNTRSRGLPESPATPAGTDRTGQVCFDRAALDSALRDYRREVSGLIAEGSEAVIDRAECVAGWPR